MSLQWERGLHAEAWGQGTLGARAGFTKARQGPLQGGCRDKSSEKSPHPHLHQGAENCHEGGKAEISQGVDRDLSGFGKFTTKQQGTRSPKAQIPSPDEWKVLILSSKPLKPQVN